MKLAKTRRFVVQRNQRCNVAHRSRQILCHSHASKRFVAGVSKTILPDELTTVDRREESGLPPEVDALLNSPDLERPEGTSPYQFLKVTEAYWRSMKKHKGDPGPAIVHRIPGSISSSDNTTASTTTSTKTTDFDVIICGGTLGIFLALALQQKGHKVCVLEKRALQGRSQEWNISRDELDKLVSVGVLTAQELESCIATEWTQDRLLMKGGKEIWVEGVLNLGVSPRTMLDILKEKFLAAGGVLQEHTAFKGADVRDDGVQVNVLRGAGSMPVTAGDVNRPMGLAGSNNNNSSSSSTQSSYQSNGANGSHNTNGNNLSSTNGTNGTSAQTKPKSTLTCKLLVDCMGHYSPIVKQIRGGQQPDGMVIVVGGAMSGIPSENNTTADLIHTFTDAENDMQLFWEAFPSDGGKLRTSYMFTYADVDDARPDFTTLLQMYLHYLPQYQGVPLSEVSFKRVLFGGFPCYMKGSPLKPAFDRVLQIGDASAAQSPLSFGGFACMVRHLPRLAEGVDEALKQEKLDVKSLAWMQPYQPSLSLAWLYQRAMSIRVGQLAAVNNNNENSLSSASNGTENGTNNKAVVVDNNKKKKRGWLPADHINRLMRCNFAVMAFLGDSAMKSFLLDTMRLLPLTLTMWGMMLRDPIVVTRVLVQVGPKMIIDWFRHFVSLAVYTVLYKVLKPFKPLMKGYRLRRFVDALRWGSSAA